MEEADAVLLNPPRQGCRPAVLQALIERGAERLAYLSCSPDSLARDLAVLVEAGFSVDQLTPLDMMPQTPHLEVFARLSRDGER